MEKVERPASQVSGDPPVLMHYSDASTFRSVATQLAGFIERAIFAHKATLLP